MNSRPSLGSIYLSFLKMGALLIGGGYALLPLLEEELVRRRGWAREGEMADYYALAQLLPGVIAINTSMLVGNRLRGFAGNLAAAAGVTTVPFLLIAAYALTYSRVSAWPAVERALAGMRPAVAGMILGFGVNMVFKSLAPLRRRRDGADATRGGGR